MRRGRLTLDQMLLNWPTKDTRIKTVEKCLQQASLRSSLTSQDTILGTAQMTHYKHFLPLVRLAFETWIAKTGKSIALTLDQPDRALLLAHTVEEYAFMLFLTLCDWIAPNLTKSAEFVETVNFWHFEQLVLMIHDVIVWPCSSYVLTWTERLLPKSEENAKSKIGHLLDFLLQLSSSLPSSIIYSALQSISMDYASLSRPMFLEEAAMLESERSNMLRFTSPFYIPQMSRTTATHPIDLSMSDSSVDTIRPHEDAIQPLQIDSSSFSSASFSALSFVSLRSQHSSLPFIAFLLQDIILGDYPFHGSLNGLAELLSQVRAAFNESTVSFLTQVFISFLSFDHQLPKQSVHWYKARGGLACVMIKLVRILAKSPPHLSGLERFVPTPPSSFCISMEHAINAALHQLITKHEYSFLREVEQQGQDDTGSMNLSGQISLLPDFISVLGHSHLLSFSSIQQLIQNTGREELRVLLEEPVAKTFIFNPEDVSDLPLPDLANSIENMRNNKTVTDFTDALQVVMQEICGGPSRYIAVVSMQRFLATEDAEVSLQGEMDASDQSNSDSATFGLTKLSIIYEYLSYSPVFDIMLVALPLEGWLKNCLSRLLRLEKAIETSTDWKETARNWANFSASVLFLTNLIAATHHDKNPLVKTHLLDLVRRFAQTDLAPHSANHNNAVDSLNNVDDHFDIDDSCPSNQLPHSAILDFVYALLVDENEYHAHTASPDHLLSIIFNSASNSEICSLTPWQWVLSTRSLVDACLKFICVRGPGEERYDLLYPLLDALQWITSKIPALRPFILRAVLSEYFSGTGDSNQLLHGTYLPVIVQDLILRWIHYPMMAHGVTPGDTALFARLVCISHCKELLWQLLQQQSEWRMSEWGQSLEPLVQPEQSIDPVYLDNLLPAISEPDFSSSAAAATARFAITTKSLAHLDLLWNAILHQSTDPATHMKYRYILGQLSATIDASQVARSVAKQFLEIVGIDQTEAVRDPAIKRDPELVSASMEMSTPDKRTEAQNLVLVEKLAYCLAQHCLSNSPSPTAVITSFLEEVLPCLLQTVTNPRVLQMLAHFTFFAIISSTNLRTTLHTYERDGVDAYGNSKITESYWTATGRPEAVVSLHTTLLLLIHVGRVSLSKQESGSFEALSSIIGAALVKSESRDADPPALFFALLLSRLLTYTSVPFLFPELTLPFVESLIANGMSPAAVTLAVSPGAPSSLMLPIWKLLCLYNRPNSTAPTHSGPDQGEPTPLTSMLLDANDIELESAYANASTLPVIDVIKLR